jgi:hypothetical protein
LSIVNENQLRAVLRVMLDEAEFLSGFGIRPYPGGIMSTRSA